MPFVVAEITRDHLYERWYKEGRVKSDETSEAGRLFTFEALSDWFDWPNDPDELIIPTSESDRVRFKLYDDDDELYYSGWLYNDDSCIVQQFVLRWAEAGSGCTTILVKKDDEAGYVQEIG